MNSNKIRLLEKEVIKEFKILSKKDNFKSANNSFYKKIDEFFVHFFISFKKEKDSITVSATNYIKLYEYDNIFWKLMNMSENINKKESLRASGAFIAPSLNIFTQKQQLMVSSSYESNITILYESIQENFTSYLNQINYDPNLFSEILIKSDGYYKENLLKMLAFLYLKDYNNAFKLSKEEINKGRKGGFQVDGEDIYEYIYLYSKNNL